jgi:transposase
MLPEAYIAPPELRDLREPAPPPGHAGASAHLDQEPGHALLARQGILPDHTDLFGPAGGEYLAKPAAPGRSAPGARQLLALIGDFDRELADTTNEIEQRTKADERVKLLCQIRGIGRYTAMLIIAEIGEVKRFPTAKHLCQWAGFTPTVRRSDGKAHLGHTSRQGSTILRWAL